MSGFTESPFLSRWRAGTSDNIIHAAAGEAIGGHRVVAVNAVGAIILAGSNKPTLMPLGISVGAAAVGAMAKIQIDGELIEPSWNWTLNLPIYMGVDGVLTQVSPTTGLLCIVAYPMASNKISLCLGDNILL